MSKHRRLNDIGRVDEKEIVDMLDDYPYFYRSLQAIKYINEDPLIII